MKSRKLILLGVVLLFLFSCATSSKFMPSGRPHPRKNPGQEVEIYRTAPHEVKYKELGVVTAEKHNGGNWLWSWVLLGIPMAFLTVDYEDVVPLLKEEGRKAGADAVIDIQIKSDNNWHTKLTGSAIVYE